MLASGVFVGILGQGEPSILTEMSEVLLNLLPAAMARHLHLIMGLLSAPLGWYSAVTPTCTAFFPCAFRWQPVWYLCGIHGVGMVIGKNVAMIGSRYSPPPTWLSDWRM